MTRMRLSAVLGLLLSAVALAPATAFAADKIKIGVLLSADEARYKDGAAAALQQLKADGFDDRNLVVETRSAKGDKKAAAEIAKEMAADGAKVILVMGTSGTVAAMEAVKTTPIVFSMVWDPVEAGIAKSWTASGTNATGSSNKVQLATVIKTLRRIGPVKRLGVLYNPAEKNSVSQLEDLKAVQGELGFEIVLAVVATKADAAQAARSLAGKVDAVFVTGAVTVTSQVPVITEATVEAKLPSASHLIDAVEAGVLLGVTASVQEVGRLAGAKVSSILKGGKPETMPIDTVKRFDVSVNMKTAKAAGIKVPVELLQSASRVIK